MATVNAHGIAARLPAGFEGRIFTRSGNGPGVARPIAQFATFPIPSDTADFGGGAVTQMGPTDVFAVLFEYGPESLGTVLFARQGVPRAIPTQQFHPYTLRRGLGGQSGTQWFFTEAGRPFTFYAVLGSHARRNQLVPRVNQLLQGLSVSPTANGRRGAAGRQRRLDDARRGVRR